MTPPLPPLAQRTRPGLSETLTGPVNPNRCRSCGARHADANPLTRWLEHDAWDRVPAYPDRPAVVVLCRVCSDSLIDPHPRLYRALDAGESFPGCMGVCMSCAHRSGTTCDHHDTKINGGPGLEYTWDAPPIYAHIQVSPRRNSGFRWLFTGPVRTCTGYERHPRAPVVPEHDSTPTESKDNGQDSNGDAD